MTSSISSRVPASPASSTGDSASSASCISLASRISVRSGASPDSATTMIGNSEKLISEICQFSAPAGNSASARPMASRTSAMVADLSQPNSNSRNRPAKPSDAVAVIVVSPSRSWNSDSIGRIKQAFAVFRRDAGEGDRDEEAGDVDVRLALLGQADIGRRTHGQRQDHEGDDHSRPAGGPVDDAGHCVNSS
jgi:hypothetical protein